MSKQVNKLSPETTNIKSKLENTIINHREKTRTNNFKTNQPMNQRKTNKQRRKRAKTDMSKVHVIVKTK